MHKIRKLFRPKKNKLIAAVLAFILLLNFGLSLKPRVLAPNPEVSTLPFQEKIADGVWALHNQDPVKQTLTSSKPVDTKLKKASSDKKYEWMVTLPSKTTFSFGKREDGKIMPYVEVKDVKGNYIEYAPVGAKKYISPKVNNNVVEWELDSGLVARYTMQRDRVKADYIVNDKWKIENGKKVEWDGKMDFIVLHSEGMKPELFPNGDVGWLNEAKEIFTIPFPIVIEHASGDTDSNSWSGKYSLKKLADTQTLLTINLPEDKLSKAQFPLTIDPVVIDSSSVDAFSTSLPNARHIVRDAWGNLIAVFEGGLAEGDVWYKNYDTNSWVEQVIGISGPGNSVAIDIDAEGNVHTLNDVATGVDGDIGYIKLTVTRNASNLITSMSSSTELKLDDSNKGFRPTLIVANKGEGAGKEKVVAAWAMNTTVGGTRRGEMRLLQCDVADNCATAASWKNAIETTNASGSCVEGTSGIASTTSCAGAADIIMSYQAAHTVTAGQVVQLPGVPKRSPNSVQKDISGVFTALSNTIDGNTGTTDSVNSLTTTDYVYVGDSRKFSKASLDIVNTNSQAATLSTLEYWNGASWTALSNTRDSTGVGASFNRDGSVAFDEPSDWESTSVNGTSNYWIRIRPSAAFDSSVSVGEVYVNDRNSRALMMIQGTDATSNLGVAYVLWDDVGDSYWENYQVTSPWTASSTTAIDSLGATWTTFTNYPLNVAVDYIHNVAYVSYVEDQASDVLHVKSVPNNKDVTVAANWTDSAFPSVTEGVDLVMSMTTDGSDLYMFYILDPGTNALVWRKCSPSGGGNSKICDNASDWGSQNTFVSGTTLSHPQAVVSKAGSDTIGIDVIYTDTSGLTVSYERHYVSLTDKTITVAASGDDAGYSGSDDSQTINGNTIQIGLVGDVFTRHAGFRFLNITVPQGGQVSSAFIDFRISTSSIVAFTIYGDDVDYSSGFSAINPCLTDPDCIHNRTRTTSSKSVSLTTLATTSYRFDVTDIIQEIVCRGASNTQPCVGDFNSSGSWASGNGLSLLFIGVGGAGAISVDAFDSSPNLTPTLTINLAPVGKIYSANSTRLIPTGASYANFDKSFSLNDYAAVGLDDNAYATVSASMVSSASQSAQPAFMFKVNNTNNANTSYIDSSVVVKSSVPASSKPIYLQVYRGGSTNDWVTMDSDTTTAADTDITLTTAQITSNLTDYYQSYSPGSDTCDADSANCWTYWRVYQDPLPSGGANQVLSVDQADVSYTAVGGGGGGGDTSVRGGIQVRGGSSL